MGQVGEQLGSEQCSTGRPAVIAGPVIAVAFGCVQQRVRGAENLVEDLRGDPARLEALDHTGDLVGRAVSDEAEIPPDVDHATASDSSSNDRRVWLSSTWSSAVRPTAHSASATGSRAARFARSCVIRV
jgi:hypothetical protein